MKTQALRQLLKQEPFVYMPAAYDALGGRLVEDLGFKAVYVGGFVTGGSRCTSEPLLTMDEQVRVAGDVANAVKIPAVADGGAGFGEPLHTMQNANSSAPAFPASISRISYIPSARTITSMSRTRSRARSSLPRSNMPVSPATRLTNILSSSRAPILAAPRDWKRR